MALSKKFSVLKISLEVEGMMFPQSQYTHVKRENDKKNRALLIKSVQEFFILVLKLFYVFKFKIK